MKFGRRVRKIFSSSRYRFISEQNINDSFYDLVARATGKYSLDICSGIDGILDKRFQSVDIQKHEKPDEDELYAPDYLGNILACFAPSYVDDPDFVDENEALLDIPESYWKTIRIKHGIEHIAWRFQGFLFKWLYELLEPGGTLYIATPNLGYIVGVYNENRERQKYGEEPIYPVSEHIYCKQGVSWHMQQWVWFKLYSGGSPGDNHFCCHDSFSLGNMLYEIGFKRINIFDGHTLIVTCRKPSSEIVDVDTSSLELSVKSATGNR
jgi:predicted SAM-dependent methyltransferase